MSKSLKSVIQCCNQSKLKHQESQRILSSTPLLWLLGIFCGSIPKPGTSDVLGAQKKRSFLLLWAWWQWLVFLSKGEGGQGLPTYPLVIWREWQREGLHMDLVTEWNWGRVSRMLWVVEVWRGACVELLWEWGRMWAWWCGFSCALLATGISAWISSWGWRILRSLQVAVVQGKHLCLPAK